MYTKVTIDNFRCFEHLEVGPLARVNLITGANNVGKTALLEALYLHANFSRPAVFLHLNRWRGLTPGQDDDSLTGAASFVRFFPGLENARVAAHTDVGRVWELALRTSPRYPIRDDEALDGAETPRGGFSVSFGAEGDEPQFTATVTPEMLGSMDATATPAAAFLPARDRFRPEEDIARLASVPPGRADTIIAMARVIEPRLSRLGLRSPGPSVLYAELGDSFPPMMPLPLLGEGLGRLLSFALAVATTDSSLEGHRALFIDEIENGIYHKAMPDVWRGLAHAAREFDVQLFATTHSWECVRAAVEAFRDDFPEDLHLHRLDRLDDGTIKATTYKASTLRNAVDMNVEVR